MTFEWNWYYLIPIVIGLISVICWLVTFFINYKTSKSVSEATIAANEAVNSFKGALCMVKIRNKDGTITVLEEKTETVEETAEEVVEETAETTAEATVMSAAVEEATSKTDDTEDFIKFLRKLYNAFKE